MCSSQMHARALPVHANGPEVAEIDRHEHSRYHQSLNTETMDTGSLVLKEYISYSKQI